MPIDFTPKPAETPKEPEPAEMYSPEWVVETWRQLYLLVPSPNLKKQVEAAESWIKEQTDGGL